MKIKILFSKKELKTFSGKYDRNFGRRIFLSINFFPQDCADQDVLHRASQRLELLLQLLPGAQFINRHFGQGPML
jgi:hypothetical protein